MHTNQRLNGLRTVVGTGGAVDSFLMDLSTIAGSGSGFMSFLNRSASSSFFLRMKSKSGAEVTIAGPKRAQYKD